jgi:hypothetical protein
MEMSNRGQMFFVTIMIALIFIILALVFAPVIKDFTTTAMNDSTDTSVGLNCTNPLSDTYTKANCLFVDYMNPYFVGFMIFGAGAIIGARLLL